jgi:hypothetical protein
VVLNNGFHVVLHHTAIWYLLLNVGSCAIESPPQQATKELGEFGVCDVEMIGLYRTY